MRQHRVVHALADILVFVFAVSVSYVVVAGYLFMLQMVLLPWLGLLLLVRM